jgi:hypothetical protein
MTTRAFAFIITFATVAKVKSNGALQHTSQRGSKMHLDRTKVSEDSPSIQQNTHVAALSTLHYAHQCTLGRGILAKVSWKRPSKEASNRQASVRTKLYKSIATWLTTLVTKRQPRNHAWATLLLPCAPLSHNFWELASVLESVMKNIIGS